MSHETLVELTRRTLAHGLAGTIPLAEGIGRVPARNYLDPDRWRHEMEAVFGRLPLVVGYSGELGQPHAYKALEVAGVPLLLVRTAEGEVRGFVNSCSHRGAVVVPDGMGTARRFSCPYHGWTYDTDGRLVGVVDRDEFGPLDTDCAGLTPLPVAERAGIIFAGLRPGAPLEIDRFLCGYDAVLEQHRFAECHVVGSQSVEGPNWKVAYDGYLDFYHLPVLHRSTFGPKASNKAIYDSWGPHQRVSSPDKRTLGLDGVAEDEWPHEVLTGGVWTIFPHTSIAGFPVKDADGDGGLLYMMSTLYPGSTPDTSVTVQTFLAAFEPTESLHAVIAAQQQFLLGVVRDEDYYTGRRLQRALAVGAKEHVLFGRNELGGQRFHRWVDAILDAATDEQLAKLFIDAEISFQP